MRQPRGRTAWSALRARVQRRQQPVRRRRLMCRRPMYWHQPLRMVLFAALWVALASLAMAPTPAQAAAPAALTVVQETIVVVPNGRVWQVYDRAVFANTGGQAVPQVAFPVPAAASRVQPAAGQPDLAGLSLNVVPGATLPGNNVRLQVPLSVAAGAQQAVALTWQLPGGAPVRWSRPALWPTTAMVVLAPGDSARLAGIGLFARGDQQLGGTRMHALAAENVAGGSLLTITVTRLPWWVTHPFEAIALPVLVLLAAGTVVWWRRRRRRRARTLAIAAIEERVAELDVRYRSGLYTEAEPYEERRARLVEELMAAEGAARPGQPPANGAPADR